MNVYRVEHKQSGYGPYMGLSMFDPLMNNMRYFFPGTCPGPREDGIHQDFSGKHFGFKRVRDLVNWFRFRDILKLKKKGFVVYRYRVEPDHVFLGEKQVCFAKNKSYSRVEVSAAVLARHIVLSRFGS